MPTAMTYRYFNIPFALTGDQVPIPDATQPSGDQSFNEGRGYKYALDPASDPNAKILSRQQDNYLYFAITQALQNTQQHYVPEFIDSDANGGVPFSYSKKDRVRLPSTNETYESLVDSNTTTPPSSSWVVVPQTGTTYLPVAATVGGTGNAITADFDPDVGNPSTPTAVWVRAIAANSGATTFNPDGAGAKAMYKGNNQPLVGGEIAGAGQWLLLIRDTTLDKWMLANPYLTAASVPDASTVVKGIGYLATNVEAQAGVDSSKFITPASLASVTATTSRAGLAELATNAEVQAQASSSLIVTPAGLGSCTATTTRNGIAALATQAEVNAGVVSDKIVTPATLLSRLTSISMVVQHSLANNTQSGATSSNTWNVRPLNTVVSNSISGASLSANTITLPAGTYRITALGSIYTAQHNKMRLRNTADNSDTLIGINNYTTISDDTNLTGLSGEFTIASSKTFQLQHWVNNGNGSQGFGVPVNAGVNEVYTSVEITKIG